MSRGQRDTRSSATVPWASMPAAAARATRPAPLAESTGAPLAPSVRSAAERSFDSDFSSVRIHADAGAAASARAIGAAAYTVGSDIVFGAGRYAPHEAAGRELLAHELAHVVQQSRGGSPGGAEARADHAAARAARGGRVDRQALGGAPVGVQAKPEGPAPLPIPGLAMDRTLDSVELEAGVAIGKDNPQLMQLAAAYKASGGGGLHIRLSADVPSDMIYNTAQASAERARLNERLRAARDALVALGVPFDAIDIFGPSGYAKSARGQVSAALRQRAAPTPSFAPGPGPAPAPGPGAPGPAPAPSGLPSPNLEFTFGPVTISLPKEVRAKLPIALGGGKKLTIDLGATAPAKFSLKITLDGIPYVRLALKSGAEVDTKNGAVTGSAGLQIETLASSCVATDPGETLQAIKAAGDKLNKAVKEHAEAPQGEGLDKLIDIAGAIGEIYAAVDKAKAKCSPVPRATFDFGYKRLLTPGSEADPTKLPPLDYFGVTGTFRF